MASLLLTSDAVFAMVTNDPQLNLVGGVETIQLPQAWDITQGSSDVVVAVIDAGVDISNPDLINNIWLNPNEKSDAADNDGNGLVDDIHGWNFVKNNGDVRPSPTSANASRIGLNHGSVIAGIIGAEGNNGIGGAGVSWHVKIIPLKILDERGDGDTDLAVKAIDYAIQKKANIINLSFVGPTPSLDFIQAVRRAYRAGILVVAAAGNAPEGGSGTNLNFVPQYPVCFDDPLKEENWVLGVAALTDLGALAPFSNFGSKCIDVAAPGFRLPSTMLFDPPSGNTEIYGGAWSGTSVAAPFVSGVAALIKSIQPTWGPDEIRKAILNTVDPIPGNTDHAAGLGSINAFKAAQYARQGGDGGLPEGFYVASVTTSRGVVAHILNTQFDEIKNFIVGPARAGEIHVVTADLHASGVAQIVATVPDRRGSLVRTFQRDGKLLKEFRPFGTRERGPLSIAILDIDSDGFDELVVASSAQKRVMILNGDGTVRGNIMIPETKGVVTVAAHHFVERSIITTAVQQGKAVIVYEWDPIGTYISDFSTTLDAPTPLSFGFTNANGGVAQMYIAQQSASGVHVQNFSLRGELLQSFDARPSAGQLFGFAFGRVNAGTDPHLVLGVSQNNTPRFEVMDAAGASALTIKNNNLKSQKFINLYFGK